MASKAVVIVVASFLLVVLLCSLYSIPVFAKISKGPITCTPIPKYNKSIFGPQIECCQTETDSEGIAITYCTLCDDTEPPSNCGGRYTYQASNPLGNALPPGNNTGTPGKTSIFNPIRNATNALPSSNGTGTLPPGSVIKVPPGTVGSATNPPPTNNNTGNPIAMTSSDNPSGCSKKIPIPPNCTLNPFNNSASNKAEPQQIQTQQTTGHHDKGSNTGASTSTGNSTGH